MPEPPPPPSPPLRSQEVKHSATNENATIIQFFILFIIRILHSRPPIPNCGRNIISTKAHIKKVRESELIAHPEHKALASPPAKDKQCRSPRCMYMKGYTQTMDIEHCLILWRCLNLLDSVCRRQDVDSMPFYMSVARLPPVRATERTTGQR